MRKLVSFLLAGVLIFSLSACGGNGGGTAQGTTTAQDTTAAVTTEASTDSVTTQADSGAAVDTTTDQSAGSTDLYELTVVDPNYTGNNAPTLVSEYIKNKFGIVVKHVPYQGDIQEQQMMLLASKDYGEVQRMEYDRVYKAYNDAGVLLSLDPYLDKMPDFQRVFADAIPYFRLAANGKLIRWDVDVPLHGETDIEVDDMLTRTDVLEKYGWPTPVSEDDWVAFLKQAMIDFPTTPDGVKTLGMVCPFAESWGLSFCATANYEKGDHFVELSNEDGGVLFDMKQDKFVDYFLEPSVKDSYAFFNRMYREGILDVESLTDDWAAVQAKLDNGSALSAYYIVWAAPEANAALQTAGHDEMSYITMPLQSNAQVAEGQKRAIRVEDTRIYNAWGITDNCKHPERIAEFINWACTDEGQIMLQNGPEGELWVRNAQGKRELTDNGVKFFKGSDPDYNDTIGVYSIPFAPHFNILLSDGQYPSITSESAVADQFLQPRVKEAYDKLGWASSKSWWVDHGFFASTGLPGAISVDPSDPTNDIATKMYELRVKTTANLIQADTPQEFEDIYNAAVQEHLKLNPQQVVDKYNEIYQQQKALMK